MLTRRKALKDEAKVCVEHTTQSTKIKRKPPLSPKPKETVKKRGKTDSKPESKNQRAKMTSERNADHIHHIQKEPSSTNTTNLTAQTSRLAIERLMSLKYANVVERMKLTFPAKCTQLLIDCCTEHARNQYIQFSDNTSEIFLKNRQPLMFFHVIQMDVLQNIFPGHRTLQSLFELTLVINRSITDEYEVNNAIDMATFTINSIMEKFPPCWLAANLEYRQFLQSQKKILISGSHEILDSRTLFADIICGLETIIQPPKKTVIEEIPNDSFNDSLDLQCYRTFESQNTQKLTYDKLQREDKIHRLFLTLSMYVQLFEADLAMWTLRNLRNSSAKIFDSKKGPLVGTVLWAHGEPNQVNYCIKNILKIYVDYIYIGFPCEYTKIVGRLVNIIYNVFELSEFGKLDDAIEYPRFEHKQSHFCDALTKIMFEHTGGNVGLWIGLIRIIEHPRMKLYLINALLTKIEHKSIHLKPENIYLSLCEIENELDESIDESAVHNNNNVKLKSSTSNQATTSSSNHKNTKYPYLHKANRRAASELTIEQNAELYLIALNAYTATYHTEELRQWWTNYNQYDAQLQQTVKRYRTEQFTPEPFDRQQLEKLQQKPLSERIKATGMDSQIYNLDVMNTDANIVVKARADIMKYRNDLKFIDLIISETPKLRKKFESLFPKIV